LIISLAGNWYLKLGSSNIESSHYKFLIFHSLGSAKTQEHYCSGQA